MFHSHVIRSSEHQVRACPTSWPKRPCGPWHRWHVACPPCTSAVSHATALKRARSDWSPSCSLNHQRLSTLEHLWNPSWRARNVAWIGWDGKFVFYSYVFFEASDRSKAKVSKRFAHQQPHRQTNWLCLTKSNRVPPKNDNS